MFVFFTTNANARPYVTKSGLFLWRRNMMSLLHVCMFACTKNQGRTHLHMYSIRVSRLMSPVCCAGSCPRLLTNLDNPFAMTTKRKRFARELFSPGVVPKQPSRRQIQSPTLLPTETLPASGTELRNRKRELPSFQNPER